MSLRERGIVWCGLSIVVLLLDILTKWLAVLHLSYAVPVPVVPFLNLTLLYNYGAAFSFLSDANSLFPLILFSSIAIVISLWIIGVLWQMPRTEKYRSFAFSLILGGALGNACDRLFRGFVVDFMDVYVGKAHWPAFNLADTAVCVGVGLLLLQGFRFSTPKRDTF